jgi:hypothetical protein
MIEKLLSVFLTICMFVGVYDVVVWVHKKVNKK